MNIVQRIRPPPARDGGSDRPEEADDIGLTTGKTVPRWRNAAWIALAVFLLLVAAVVGLVVGLVVVRLRVVDPDPIVRLIPFIGLPDAQLNFLVVGDWGNDGHNNQTLTAEGMATVASMLKADFVISTGDNFNPQGLHNISDPQFKTSFTDIYTASSLQVQWWAVLGDVDYRIDPENELDLSLNERDTRWHIERNYRRKFKACSTSLANQYCPYTIEFFFIDTSPLVQRYWTPAYQGQLNFTGLPDYDHSLNYVLNILKDGLHSSDATWKVLVGHHPAYSSGEHGRYPQVERYLTYIIQQFEVDIYINGHDHNLELLQVPDTKAIFVTSGAGSLTNSSRTTDTPGTTLFYSDSQGFVSMSVLGPSIDLRFHDAVGLVLYNVTLTKD